VLVVSLLWAASMLRNPGDSCGDGDATIMPGGRVSALIESVPGSSQRDLSNHSGGLLGSSCLVIALARSSWPGWDQHDHEGDRDGSSGNCVARRKGVTSCLHERERRSRSLVQRLDGADQQL